MIRAAHAKEKQLLENSRNRPNRLNLLDLTAYSSVQFRTFLRKIRAWSDFRYSNARASELFTKTLGASQEICLYGSKLGLLRRAPPEEAT